MNVSIYDSQSKRAFQLLRTGPLEIHHFVQTKFFLSRDYAFCISYSTESTDIRACCLLTSCK